MRINKYLSAHGICSRREADRLVGAGCVRVNKETALTGQDVSETDLVEVNGIIVKGGAPEIFLAVNKPRGVVVTTDRRFRDPVLEDLVPKHPRVFAIGRLDKESEGLILMTNNGEASNRIQMARFYHEKEYEVVVDHPMTQTFLKQMEKGVFLEEPGRTTRPCRITRTGRSSFRIVLTEGMNRQIRRMCGALGYKVVSLRRIRIMNIHLGELPCGAWRRLSADEVRTLKEQLKEPQESAGYARR